MKKQPTSKLQKKLTKLFNEYIRKRDIKFDGGKCISCGKQGNQAGHYLPTSLCPQPYMRFNEKNVNIQCFRCNMVLRGNQHDYAKGLLKKYGSHIIEELDIQRSFKQNPWGIFEYEVLIKHYKEKLCELRS